MTEVCDLTLWLSFMVQLCDFNITVNSNDSLFDLALWFSSTVMFNHVLTHIYLKRFCRYEIYTCKGLLSKQLRQGKFSLTLCILSFSV